MNTWGFFRLWIVGTALFVMSVAFLSYADIKDEFDERTILQESKKNETVVPVLCGDARGVAGADYTNNQAVCWYAMSKFRPLYPEELARKLYADRGANIRFPPPPKPWRAVGRQASIAFGIPLVVLILGAPMVWGFSWFAAPQSTLHSAPKPNSRNVAS
jgi:hypothetical protein